MQIFHAQAIDQQILKFVWFVWFVVKYLAFSDTAHLTTAKFSPAYCALRSKM